MENTVKKEILDFPIQDGEDIQSILKRKDFSPKYNRMSDLEFISSFPALFENEPLLAANFSAFVEIGQENSIHRELTRRELLQMKDAYINHCREQGYTRKDLFEQLYSVILSQVSKQFEGKPEQKMTKFDKVKAKLLLAKEFGFDKKLFKSRKINKAMIKQDPLRGIRDLRKTLPFDSNRKNLISVANVFADNFALFEGRREAITKNKKIQPITTSRRAEAAVKGKINIDTIKNTEELIHITRPQFKENILYKPHMGRQTKQRIKKLAAAAVLGASLVAGAVGVANVTIDAVSNTMNNIGYSTVFSDVTESGYTLQELGLSSSYPQDFNFTAIGLYGEDEITTNLISFIQENGTIGVYNDITEKLANYKDQHIPTTKELEALALEIKVLPQLIANDKLLPAYKNIGGKADCVTVESFVSSDTRDDIDTTYRNVTFHDGYSQTSYDQHSFFDTSPDLGDTILKFADNTSKSEKFYTDITSMLSKISIGEASEYDVLNLFKKQSGNLQKIVEKAMNLSATNISFEDKGFNLLSSMYTYDTENKIVTSNMKEKPQPSTTKNSTQKSVEDDDAR